MVKSTVYCYVMYDDLFVAHIDHWLQQVEKFANANAIVMLVRSKIDLCNDRVESLQVGRSFASSRQLPYVEVSSKTGEGVQGVVGYAVKRLLAKLCANKKEKVKPVKAKSNCDIS